MVEFGGIGVDCGWVVVKGMRIWMLVLLVVGEVLG